jgi:hypothetical protein
MLYVSGARWVAPFGALLLAACAGNGEGLAANGSRSALEALRRRACSLQFVQLRAGVRYSDGIPQLDSEHTRLYFIGLHGFF